MSGLGSCSRNRLRASLTGPAWEPVAASSQVTLLSRIGFRTHHVEQEIPERTSRSRPPGHPKIRKKDQASVRSLDYAALMVRSMLSVLAGIAVLKQSSFASEAAVNPPGLRVFPQALRWPTALSTNQWVRALTFCYGLACVAGGGYAAARYHASRRHWIIIAILSVPAALAGRTLYKRKETR
jgi:hypothetical protein